MRIVFMGTPGFAVPALEALAAGRDFELAGVVCQPDRPAGRGGGLRAPEVKTAALRLGLEVCQPESMRQEAAWAWLREREPEALAVVAFGQLLPRRVFELPKLGAINAHASLLPKYRGAAPIQWAIAIGETETGVTTMQIDAGLDTGAMLLHTRVGIGPQTTAPELSRALAAAAAELLPQTLRELAAGTLRPDPQPGGATLAPLLQREHGRVDWALPARTLYNRWRGFQPWPGLWTIFQGRRLAVLACRPLDEPKGLAVRCGTGWLGLERVQLEGRRPVSGSEFARGARLDAPVLDPFASLS